MSIPLARSSEEAFLYLDINPCGCGQAKFDRHSTVLAAGDDMLRRYDGTCPNCGAPREFLFRLPATPLPPAPPGNVQFGDERPSELLDAGQWMWIADVYSGLHPADPDQISPLDLPRARADLAFAAAAQDEVAKFIPADADSVPATAFWTERGRQMHRSEPYRFRRSSINAVRDTYADLLARLGQIDGGATVR